MSDIETRDPAAERRARRRQGRWSNGAMGHFLAFCTVTSLLAIMFYAAYAFAITDSLEKDKAKAERDAAAKASPPPR